MGLGKRFGLGVFRPSNKEFCMPTVPGHVLSENWGCKCEQDKIPSLMDCNGGGRLKQVNRNVYAEVTTRNADSVPVSFTDTVMWSGLESVTALTAPIRSAHNHFRSHIADIRFFRLICIPRLEGVG